MTRLLSAAVTRLRAVAYYGARIVGDWAERHETPDDDRHSCLTTKETR